MADTALDFVVQIGFPACSFRGSPQERTGLTIRSSRCHFTAAIFFGMFVLVCGRAVARLNSGVRRGKRQFALLLFVVPHCFTASRLSDFALDRWLREVPG